MGILKNLTEEYFGDALREEESKMSEIIKANKRKFLLKLFEKETDKKKNYMVYHLDDHPENVVFMTEMQAGDFMLKKFDAYDYSLRGLSRDVLLATEETYEKLAPDFDRLPDDVKEVFREIFKLYCEQPVFISSYLCAHFNPTNNSFGKIFPNMIKFQTLEEHPEFYDYGEDSTECILITIPDGRCSWFTTGENFVQRINELSQKLEDAFEKNGYSLPDMTFFDPLGFGSVKHTKNFLFIKKGEE